MITRFYVKTQDHKCPLAHRYDAVPEGYVFRGESNYAQGDLWPFEKRDNRYLVTYIDGLEDPGSTLTDTEIANADGSKFIRSQISKRTLTIKVLFNPELNGPELIEARTDLANVFGSGKMVQLYLIDSYKPWNGADPIIKEVDNLPEVGVPEEMDSPVIYSTDGKFYKWDGSKYYETFESNNFRNVLGEIGWIATGRVETFEADIYSQDCAASISIVCNDPKLYYWAYNRLTYDDILYNHRAVNNDPTPTDFAKDGTSYRYLSKRMAAQKVSPWYRFTWKGEYQSDFIWGNELDEEGDPYYNPYKTSRTSETQWNSFTPSTVEISTLRNHYDGSDVKFKEVVTSPIDVSEYVRKSHGLEFHDNANIPLTIRFERGDNFPSSHRTDGSYSPSIEYAYYEVNENYVSEIGNTGEYYLYVNPGDINIFDDKGDRLTIYNEGFCDTSEINACSKISNVDAAHIRNRDAEAYNKKLYRKNYMVTGTVSSPDRGNIGTIQFPVNASIGEELNALTSDDVERFFRENGFTSQDKAVVGEVTETTIASRFGIGDKVLIYIADDGLGYTVYDTNDKPFYDKPIPAFMLFNDVPATQSIETTENDFEYDSAKKLLHNIPLTEDAWPMIPKGTLGSYTIRTILHGGQLYKNVDFIHSLKLTTVRYNPDPPRGDNDETRYVDGKIYIVFNEVNAKGQNRGNRGWAIVPILNTKITSFTDKTLKDYFISEGSVAYDSLKAVFDNGQPLDWSKWKDGYKELSNKTGTAKDNDLAVFYNELRRDSGHPLGVLEPDTYYIIRKNSTSSYEILKSYRAGGTNVPKWGYDVPSKYNIVRNVNPFNVGEIHFSINFQKGTSLTQENIAQYFIQNGITNSANAMDCTFHTWNASKASNQEVTVFYDQAKERFTLDRMNYTDSSTLGFRTYVPKSATVHDSITSTSLRDLPDDTFEKASVYMRPYRMSL